MCRYVRLRRAGLMDLDSRLGREGVRRSRDARGLMAVGLSSGDICSHAESMMRHRRADGFGSAGAVREIS